MGHNSIIRPQAVELVQAYYVAQSSLPCWPRMPLTSAHINELIIIVKGEEPHTRQPNKQTW